MIPISYNIRSLAVRKTTTIATAAGIGLVVFVLSSVLMLGDGIERTMGASGSDKIAIVIRKGSDAEMSSSIRTPDVPLVTADRAVARRPDGQPDAVAEVVVVISLDKVGTDGVSNALVRGITDDVWAFRPDVRVVEGRKPRPGADEAVIGRAIRGRFKGLELGQSVELRKNQRLKVVGILEADGSSYESEVWADRDTVAQAFGREGYVQSIRVRLSTPSKLKSFERAVESNRRLGLEVYGEPQFFEKASEGTALFIRALGIVIAVFFSIGAMIGAMITMYAAVAGRKREIATLRALGFSKFSIMLSFVLEAISLALVGGAFGAAASMLMIFVRPSMINMATWSEIVFKFTPTVEILVTSLIFAGAMGLFGGLLPAIRAARMPLIQAMRN
jgi:putative ABC transport system permease protein